ncbi:MAG: DUF465 domain-containing protein [Rickettsiales bacterium]|nr:DUF465 domain-containing protein [Rickettsiales bacterium]MCA0254134.1 DUF465 domain-containing protein [Pseudomonadota bacterium]
MQNDISRMWLVLHELESEHQELNQIIDDPELSTKFSEFTIQQLKKRKLLLKDKIKVLKLRLQPDIIA